MNDASYIQLISHRYMSCNRNIPNLSYCKTFQSIEEQMDRHLLYIFSDSCHSAVQTTNSHRKLNFHQATHILQPFPYHYTQSNN